MPLKITSVDKNPICVLSQWTVSGEEEFVHALAWLYLRKPIHAARIVEGLAPGFAAKFGNAKQGAIKLLSYDVSDLAADLASSDAAKREAAEKKRQVRISHRDGLLFQHVSWIAARTQFPKAEASPPHVRKADKGFDGLLVQIDKADPTQSRIVLCEDKASTSPRGLVTSSIWPELKTIVAGERDLEVLDAVTALLKSLPDEEREVAISRIVWDRARSFRVALTAGNDQIKGGTYNHLFEGYETSAVGDVSARLAEVMPLDDVRKDLDKLANAVIAKLEAWA